MFKLNPKNKQIIIAISGYHNPEIDCLDSYLESWEGMLDRFAEDNHRRGFVEGYKAGAADEKEKFEACDAYQQGFTCGYDDGARENETPEIWEETTETTETTEIIPGWNTQNEFMREIPQAFDDIPTDSEKNQILESLANCMDILEKLQNLVVEK